MILYIAEKPSLGRAIADALPKPLKKSDGFITASNGDVVSWCIGHLLEQAEPDAYNSAFKQWKMEHLPILPEQWQLQAKPKTRKQLTVLRKLIKEASQIVHAGDPDREGQLLVDEVLSHLKVPKTKLANTQRLLISDLNLPAVKQALKQLKPNKDFVPLSVSALARSRADWLYGINMTRAFTLQGRKVGYNAVLSVGRVQTPILGLVVRRDEEIEHFQSKPFYEVFAQLTTLSDPSAPPFRAKWKPSEACQPYMDEEGRVLSKALAENVIKRVSHQPATVISYSSKNKQQAQPLPYNLSALQIDASKRYNLSAQQTLDACQALYEKHKLITYPRSDNRYLPSEHHSHAPAILGCIRNNLTDMQEVINKADPTIKTNAWNDKKVEAHHAIIPTEKTANLNKISATERNIYQLISRQYLALFYPVYRYQERKAEIEIQKGHFTAQSRQDIDLGWKALFLSPNKSSTKNDQTNATQTLPELVQGQELKSHQAELAEKQTQPPQYFTDATLLSAMTGIGRYVKDPNIKKVLRETDGLGTEATRASIIELLFKRKFLTRQGKQIRSTQTGKTLINALPEQASQPDMTADWEAKLARISERSLNYQGFMSPLEANLNALIEQAKTTQLGPLPPVEKRPFKARKSKAKTSRSKP
jgi:DNA topoisomerase-3